MVCLLVTNKYRNKYNLKCFIFHIFASKHVHNFWMEFLLMIVNIVQTESSISVRIISEQKFLVAFRENVSHFFARSFAYWVYLYSRTEFRRTRTH
jgi:hypothetical protein